MKKTYILAITFILMVANAFGQEKSTKNPSVFRLGADIGFSQVGYLDTEGGHNTQFFQIQMAPDYRFCQHFGVRMDLGWGRSFWSNLGGASTLHPVFTSQQATAFLAPYFEWDFGKCYADIALGANLRYRDVDWGGYDFAPLSTIAFGFGLQPRLGIHLTQKWDLALSVRFERTHYDPMRNAFTLPDDKQFTGSMFLNAGVCYNF